MFIFFGLGRKIRKIKRDMKLIIAKESKESFWINCYGEYRINPANLVFLVCVKTDEEKLRLQKDDTLLKRVKNLFTIYNYPELARDRIIVDFESQETVDRESGGDWYIHLK